MKDIFSFYKAVDPVKGSWDGYGHFPIGDNNFLAFVADAPSGASIHTPEVIKQFWQEHAGRLNNSEFPHIELADALNRLQNHLQQKGRSENLLYQSTIVIVRKIGSRLIYCCIGDSILQIYRGRKLFRLSESEVWDGSLISEDGEKARDRQKTADLRFLGSNGFFVRTSEIRTLELKDQDIILLSSDGLEDLLTPDQLLLLLKSNPEQMRETFESIFRADRVRDDATLLAIPVEISPGFQAEKELGHVQRLLDQIQRDQTELRKQLMDISPSLARLNRFETSLRQISDELHKPMKRSPNTVSQSARKRISFPWLITIVCLLLGAVAGVFFTRNNQKKTTIVQAPAPAQTEQNVQPPTKRPIIAPPEIPADKTCDYVVQKGDSLDRIAAGRGIAISELLRLNPGLKREAPLKIGQSILICKEENP